MCFAKPQACHQSDEPDRVERNLDVARPVRHGGFEPEERLRRASEVLDDVEVVCATQKRRPLAWSEPSPMK